MPNRLANESSPYLRQHAGNPVDWWPWNPAALAQARALNKPILLSVGYSACHWCHVMAHESFEDEATAAVMNELYICIKVDREERPDIDRIYQLAHQALTRRGGGWPLTVFLTPDDHLPFYAGTYFPKGARYGMPPFVHILQQIRSFWDSRRDEVRSQNAALAEFLGDLGKASPLQGAFDDAPVRAAIRQIESAFDDVHGGHRGAPKFPHCPEMELLLDAASPSTVEFTLQRMADGGIHDQLGGGFCRYSVDERWEIPHFEKMLYDNAQLLPLYANFESDSFRAAANGIVDWLRREMTSPSGGFHSALDADSEHEEGKFYVWQRNDVRGLLDDNEFAVAERHFGFDRAPNFEGHAWNLVVALSIDAIAASMQISREEVAKLLASANAKLFAARAARVRPGLDHKVLTSWNALMISGLARASRQLDDNSLQQTADRALDSLFHHAWRDDRLFATSKATPEIQAYLDDYAFLLDALTECLQNRWSSRDLRWTTALADAMLSRFEDRDAGGFFFTADDHEKLIQRPKPWFDEAIPSGNGVAVRALLRLGHLIGNTAYIDAAERTLRAAFPVMQQNPASCATLQRALREFLNPRTHVVIRFDAEEERRKWQQALQKMPRSTDIYFVSIKDTDLPALLATQTYTPGGMAYVCRGTRCLPAISCSRDLAGAL
ncbi:MAG TPA: thioredoxin domain-containing protein [Rudaea sp.]|jgi:hypothetical protein|nr:thioredoxin domain-containing protein [Rudaea sp.]